VFKVLVVAQNKEEEDDKNGQQQQQQHSSMDVLDRSSSSMSLSQQKVARKRRTRVPDKPNYPLNLWSIIKNCIGKDLTKIPMPVNFNEPLSMLQR
jgi:oxysterol-binding protein 1